MGQATENGRSSGRSTPRRRRGAKGKFAFIAVGSAVCFAAGFILLWSLGSVIVGGAGFPWAVQGPSLHVAGGAPGPGRSPARTPRRHAGLPRSLVRPGEGHLRDQLRCRQASYCCERWWPSPTRPRSTRSSSTSRTSMESVVYNCRRADGQEPGSRRAAHIRDIDALIRHPAQARHHSHRPSGVLPGHRAREARPDLAVQSKKGGIWQDNAGIAYTNPYNHEVWDYLVADRRGCGQARVQGDPVRLRPLSRAMGIVTDAVYPGAERQSPSPTPSPGSSAYARERLEPLGVWVSADVFGMITDASRTTRGSGRNSSRWPERGHRLSRWSIRRTTKTARTASTPRTHRPTS